MVNTPIMSLSDAVEHTCPSMWRLACKCYFWLINTLWLTRVSLYHCFVSIGHGQLNLECLGCMKLIPCWAESFGGIMSDSELILIVSSIFWMVLNTLSVPDLSNLVNSMVFSSHDPCSNINDASNQEIIDEFEFLDVENLYNNSLWIINRHLSCHSSAVM